MLHSQLMALIAKYNQPRGPHSSRIPFIQRLYLHLKSQPILSHLLTIQVLQLHISINISLNMCSSFIPNILHLSQRQSLVPHKL